MFESYLGPKSVGVRVSAGKGLRVGLCGSAWVRVGPRGSAWVRVGVRVSQCGEPCVCPYGSASVPASVLTLGPGPCGCAWVRVSVRVTAVTGASCGSTWVRVGVCVGGGPRMSAWVRVSLRVRGPKLRVGLRGSASVSAQCPRQCRAPCAFKVITNYICLYLFIIIYHYF